MIDAIDIQARAMLVPELTMPEPAQTIITVVLGVVALVILIIAIRMSIRYKNMTPLIFFIAGTGASVTTEALSDYLTHFTHAQIGAIPFYTAYTRVVPLNVLFIYSLYFGAWYMFAYSRMLGGRMGGNFLWKAFFFSTAMAYLFEVFPIALGMWQYFEPQPLWLWKGTLPPHFAFLNSFSIIFGVVVMDKLRTVPSPWQAPVMLIVGPIAPIMGHIGVGNPYYWTMNSGMPQWVIDLGGLASIGTCCLGVWLLIHLAYGQQGKAGQSS